AAPEAERTKARRMGSARRRRPGSSRYELLVKIATGGMATVYAGRRLGPFGFSRVVAVKRAHPHLLENAASRAMLLAEATLASKVHHPNVVGINDVEFADDELLLVMDYVEGGSLADLLEANNEAVASSGDEGSTRRPKRAPPIPAGIVMRI